jgi:peptide/nickel transport system permease protein
MYYLKRTLTAFATIFFVTVFLFLLLQVVPGDPVLSRIGMDEMEFNPRLVEQLTREFELDKPIIERYTNWIFRVVKGDLGNSFNYSNYTVNELIAQRITTTVLLAFLSLILVIIIGIPLGILLAKTEDTLGGDLLNAFSQIGLALPNFWVAIIALWLFGSVLGWFPIRGRIDFNNLALTIRSLILPVVTLSIGGIASVARYLKTSLIEEKEKDYVIVAKSKGVADSTIMKKHVFRNSLIPVTTVIGLLFISLMTGSIIIENVFSLSGLGSLLITSINANDYPVIQGVVLYYSIIVVLTTLLLDVLYVMIDPRIKLGKRRD